MTLAVRIDRPRSIGGLSVGLPRSSLRRVRTCVRAGSDSERKREAFKFIAAANDEIDTRRARTRGVPSGKLENLFSPLKGAREHVRGFSNRGALVRPVSPLRAQHRQSRNSLRWLLVRFCEFFARPLARPDTEP